jgi:hypothetical protein
MLPSLRSIPRPCPRTFGLAPIRCSFRERPLPHLPLLPLYDLTKSPFVRKRLSYASYSALTFTRQTTRAQVFHGVMHYIHFQSDNQYNREEMLLLCSGAQPGSDPISLLNPRTAIPFDAANGPFQSISVTFNHISVRPTAVAVLATPPESIAIRIICCPRIRPKEKPMGGAR